MSYDRINVIALPITNAINNILTFFYIFKNNKNTRVLRIFKIYSLYKIYLANEL